MGKQHHFSKFPGQINASYFVQSHICAADDFTQAKVSEICNSIDLPLKKSNLRAVTSFLQTCQSLEHREPYFSWLYRNGGPLASQAKVRKRLETEGYFNLAFKGFRNCFDGQAAIFELSKKSVRLADGCTFFCSSPKTPVSVSDIEDDDSLAKEIKQSEAYLLILEETKELNDFLEQHPFSIHGTIYSGGLRRKFNHGSLKSGGRFYPGYANLPKQIVRSDRSMVKPRRLATIDGESIAEVDLSAAFLSILAAQSGQWWAEDVDDPYQLIPFVAAGKGDERDFAKVLVSSIVMKDGKLKKVPTSLRLYEPKKGEEYKSFREIASTHTDKKLIGQIHDAYPFLSQPFNGQNVVFWESEVIAKTMWNAAQVGIPAYPLHDALFVRRKDAKEVQGLMEGIFRDLLGYKPNASIK